MDEQRLIATGGAIKAIEGTEGRIGGYLLVWSSPQETDLHGEYFTPETELELDGTPIKALFHHGLDATLKAKPIGVLDTFKKDTVGLWVEGVLNMHDEYVQAIYKLIQQGVLGWSSGSMPHQAKSLEDGRITYWPVYEGSATPSPAEWRNSTQVMSLKTFLAEVQDVQLQPEEQTAKEGAEVPKTDSEINSPIFEINKFFAKGNLKNMNLIDIVKEFLTALIAQGVQIGEDQVDGLAQQIAATIQPEPTMQTAVVPESEVSATIAQAQPAIMKAVQDFVAARKAQADAVKAAAAEAVKTMRQAPAINNLPAYTNSNGNGNGNGHSFAPRIEMRDRRFDHLKAADLALGHLILKSLKKDTSEAYKTAMAYKTAQMVEKGDIAANDLSVKSVFPFMKSNEVMQATAAGYGDEYVATYYGSDVWEQVRQETPVYDRMRALGMDEQEIPQGYESDTVPLEGADMTWYVAGGATDEDTGTGEVTPTASSSKFGTGQQVISVAKLSSRTYWQRELEEDSIVDVVAEANRKIRVSGKEQIENILINGDTDLNANTNINLIDGTPAAAPNRPAYTLLNGLAKLPLVTNTANTYNAGAALSEAVFLNLMPLLGADGKYAADPERILFIVPNAVYFAALNLAALKTQDVFPSATIVEGVLRKIWGVELLRSAQFGKANINGKVSATTGNNTLGRVLLVRPDQWAARWKRQIEVFTEYKAIPDTTTLVAHMRWGLGYRDNEASAIARNVSVTIA